MENQELQPEAIEYQATEEPDATYCIIKFKGPELPQDYRGLIFSHWLTSYRFGNEYIKKIDGRVYYEQYGKVLERVLNEPDCRIQLAVLSEDRDVVLGFSVSRNTSLDYIFVKKDFRRQGIGASLLPKKVGDVTHMTKMMIPIWLHKYKQWRFNPFV